MPALVAESLERIDLPLGTILHPSRSASPLEVVGQIAVGLGRPVDPRPMPDWLRPEQKQAAARLLPMLHRYRCALLADPVGSGKTWVALGVASRWRGEHPVVVLAPAAILSQWERTAVQAGVTVELWSHERLSRGNLPPRLMRPASSSLVIIDESHHFRNPGTRRYHHVAPAVSGRSVLLLSATPVVNRLGDLAAQLILGARDDALMAFGIRSLREHLSGASRASTAVGELLLTRRDAIAGKPVRVQRKERIPVEEIELEARCERIERLALSANPATAALVRSVLWRALGSSDMALLAALGRYRSLLRHARDAGAAGSGLSRASIRSFVGDDEQQLLMWELLSPLSSSHDLVLADLPLLDPLIDEAKARSRIRDSRCSRLAALLQDGKPTLVFAGARETVRYLREQIAGAAWCTGEAAGIGFSRMAREDVLSWFRPGATVQGGPVVLIATDVAAEGLDLQAAARVIHYDLPWTAVRVDQRDGRALRLGSPHARVEVVRLEPWLPIERRLRQLEALARKRRLPRQAGADDHGSRCWTWRDEISERFGAMAGAGGPGQYCVVQSSGVGLLVGFALYALEAGTQRRRLASVAGYFNEEGVWSEQPDLIIQKLEEAMTGTAADPGRDIAERSLRQVAMQVRERLEMVQQAQWTSQLSPSQSRLIARLNELAARAVHERKGQLLSTVERAINFARRGHSAGEAMWLDRLLALPDAALIGEIRQCPEAPPGTTTIGSELLGIVVFAPSCSTSTAP